MTMVTHDEDGVVTTVDAPAAEAISRSEVQSQLDAAHRYPRSIKRFLDEALTLATLNKETAESCIYALPRGGEVIAGPSVRLAEICAASWGNLHVATRILGAEEREIVAQGVAWDLERNVRVSVDVRRRITNKRGQRYDDDMIGVAGAAAQAIARRNAVFTVIPRAYVDDVYGRVRKVAVGDATTLAAKRDEVVARLQKMGVPLDRIFARVGAPSIADVGLDELEVLIGLGTAVKNKEQSIDDAFPVPDATPEKARALEEKLRGQK